MPRVSSSTCRPHNPSQPGTLDDLVAEYRRNHAPRAAREASFFRTMPSVDLLVHHVALAIDDDNRCFDHQFRIIGPARFEAKRRLTSAISKITASKSFDELHSLIDKLISEVYGIGELYVYDAAQRIGHYLGLLPDRVYLHAGVRKGVRALGLNVRRACVEVRELPKALHALPADELENFLCIYSKQLKPQK